MKLILIDGQQVSVPLGNIAQALTTTVAAIFLWLIFTGPGEGHGPLVPPTSAGSAIALTPMQRQRQQLLDHLYSISEKTSI